MKNILYTVCFILILSGCSPEGPRIDVSFYGTTGGDFNLIYDITGEGLLFPDDFETVHLKESSKSINPGVAIDYSGDFYVTTDSDDELALFGTSAYYTAELPDMTITLNCFNNLGESSVFFGSDLSGKIWKVQKESQPFLLAESAYHNITDPEGVSRTLLVHKGVITGDDWVGDLGGILYREKEDATLELIGYIEWRLIKLEDGTPMTIMMARGPGNSDPWQGWFNGTLYID